MAKNIEIKAKVPADHFDRIRKVAAELADQPMDVLEQTDTFFAVPQQRLKLREFANGTAELIAYSRTDQTGPKASSYLRSEVPDAAVLKESLSRTIGVRGTVLKRRELFLVGQTRIHLDQVEGLGTFLELEVVLDESDSEQHGVNIATELREKLGVQPDWLISCAYIDLLESNQILAS